MDEYRAVPGYEGLYELTPDGRLFSVERKILQEDSDGRKFYRLIKRRQKAVTANGRGYKAYNLHKDNRQTCRLISTLIRDTYGR
ncbi:NUMOD4 domain-containing protein [Bradyrhizobium sp.]|uniref:NUMOD4 domain-containing protein n=1 Tax=Bradyrhizobium sp. TaxID=376 RepID=UPI0025BBFBFD|nr:NUMOD4 domain-containing protein [Bradyrhizobium sp.]